MKIKVVVVEDEPLASEYIQGLVSSQGKSFYLVGAASNVEEAYLLIQEKSPDLVLLDIKLKGKTGFDLLEKFEEIPFSIIFITAFDEFAVKAIKNKAFDYLLKPLIPEEFMVAMDNIKAHFIPKRKMNLKTTDGFFSLDYADIIRCQADGNYSYIHTTNQKPILVSKTLKRIEEELMSPPFARIHKAHLVNLDFVESLPKYDEILLSNGDKLPLSRTYKTDFKYKFNRFTTG